MFTHKHRLAMALAATLPKRSAPVLVEQKITFTKQRQLDTYNRKMKKKGR